MSFVCSKRLTGRQTRFCSRDCRNKHTNSTHQSCYAQKARGQKRKIELVDSKGGQCELCGYGENYSALEFHHRDAGQKKFNQDLRALSNRSWESIVIEASKCQLVCSNCHREIHFPDNCRKKKAGQCPAFSQSSIRKLLS
jgi:hypothetical protein